MSAPVLAVGGWRNNAEMIRDAVVPLGYLHSDWCTLDPTGDLAARHTDPQPPQEP